MAFYGVVQELLLKTYDGGNITALLELAVQLMSTMKSPVTQASTSQTMLQVAIGVPSAALVSYNVSLVAGVVDLGGGDA